MSCVWRCNAILSSLSYCLSFRDSTMAVTLRIAVPFERRAYHSLSQDSPTFQKLVALRIHELLDATSKWNSNPQSQECLICWVCPLVGSLVPPNLSVWAFVANLFLRKISHCKRRTCDDLGTRLTCSNKVGTCNTAYFCWLLNLRY